MKIRVYAAPYVGYAPASTSGPFISQTLDGFLRDYEQADGLDVLADDPNDY